MGDQKYHFEALPYNGRIFNEALTLEDVEEYLPNLRERTPDELKDFQEIIEIAKAAEPELKLLRDRLLRIHKNIFPSIAEEDGIREWEAWLDLIRMSTDTREDRRFRILTRLNERIPYTWIQLHRAVASICGWDGYIMTLKDLELTIEIMTGSESQFMSVVELFKGVLPMYILWAVNRLVKAGQSLYIGGVQRNVVSQHFMMEGDKMNFAGETGALGGVRNLTTAHFYLDATEIIEDTEGGLDG